MGGERAGSGPIDVVARCACGAAFTLEQWAKLDLAGVQDDDETMLEMRNCSCGSTRARVVDFRAAVRLLNDETKRLRRALGLLRDIDRATSGLSHEIAELDRGAARVAFVIEVGVRAVELERERCLKICDETAERCFSAGDRQVVKEIAARIRKTS